MKNPGIEPIHLASQYLAAAGISFLEKQDDDSHTNLGFSSERQYLYTRPLNKAGEFLAFDLDKFALEWLGGSSSSKFMLDQRTHKEVLAWINSITRKAGFRQPYNYQFHYSLPYEFNEDYVFKKNSKILEHELKLRTLANQVLNEILEEHSLKSEIRIWPHHLDSGIFAKLPDKEGIYIGMGLAIPDTMVDTHYFYISGYQGHHPVETSSFKPLTFGHWYQEEYQGGILKADESGFKESITFFKEAIKAYSN